MNILPKFDVTKLTDDKTMYAKSKHPNLLQFDSWAKKINISHFSTTAQGGVSGGNYTSFNLGKHTGDNQQNVNIHYRFLAQILGVNYDDIYIPKQSHGDAICVVDEAFLALTDTEKENQLEDVDAIMTNQKNICVGVTTADCVPILFYDEKNNALAAAHAGWKGTVKHIGAKTLKMMSKKYGTNPKDVVIGIAPCISAEAFEVGDEVGEAFAKAGFVLSDISARNATTNKLHIDLRIANKLDLMTEGVREENIEIANLCTFSNAELFFSARRQTIHSGRMVTGGLLL